MSEQDLAEQPTAVTKRLVFTRQPTAVTKRLVFTRQPTEAQQPDKTEMISEPADQDPTSSASNPELDEMSVEDLQRKQEEIDRKIREKRDAEKQAVIAQIVTVAQAYNIPADELVEAMGGLKIKRKGIKAVQKYRDPSTGATWSGRGKEPIWIRGKNRDKFLIPEDQQ